MYILHVDQESPPSDYDSSTAWCIKFEGSKKLSVLFCFVFFHEKICPVELT